MVTAAVGGLIAVELASSCPPGGPLAFGDCERVRPFAIGVAALSGILYVAALTGVRRWTRGLVQRGVADPRAARDWYVIVAVLGLAVAPMLAFTLASALR